MKPLIIIHLIWIISLSECSDFQLFKWEFARKKLCFLRTLYVIADCGFVRCPSDLHSFIQYIFRMYNSEHWENVCGKETLLFQELMI